MFEFEWFDALNCTSCDIKARLRHSSLLFRYSQPYRRIQQFDNPNGAIVKLNYDTFIKHETRQFGTK